MNEKDFRDFGTAMVNYIADYHENIRERDVLPDVKPGYLHDRIPNEAPEKAETWRQIMHDVEKHIMPGVTHWNSPNFHAYYPTANSYPAIVGEMLSAGIGCVGFSWISSPACTELEMIIMDWLAKLLGLPEEFLNSHPGPGGGVLQGSASESTLISLLASREITVKRVKKEHPEWDEGTIRTKLVTYSSDQSNSSVEKGGRLAGMPMRLLPTDERCSLRGRTLLDSIRKDIEAGLIPCCVVATLGTTPTCAFDNLEEIGPICRKYNIWLHIDAAYAGAAFVCPEYRHLMAGIEHVDSFNFNPHKWLLVNADCSALWVKNALNLIEAFNVDRIYLAYNKKGPALDYRHWQIPLGRRFRALKVWFVLRLYGAEGLQKHIRHAISLANQFEDLVSSDKRFEIPVEVKMGLICFRLKGEDELTKQLLDRLMSRRRIYVIPGAYRDHVVVRFVVCSRFTAPDDIRYAWKEITRQAAEVLQANSKSIVTIENKPNNTMLFECFDTSMKKSFDIVARFDNLNLKIENEKHMCTFATKCLGHAETLEVKV